MAIKDVSTTPLSRTPEDERKRRAIFDLDELGKADPLTEADWEDVARRLRAIESSER